MERALAACLASEHPGTSGHRYVINSVTGELVTDETHFAPSVEYLVPTSTDIYIHPRDMDDYYDIDQTGQDCLQDSLTPKRLRQYRQGRTLGRDISDILSGQAPKGIPDKLLP